MSRVGRRTISRTGAGKSNMAAPNSKSGGGEPLGRRLHQIRKSRKLTLRAVSEKVGCTVSLLSKFENGWASPSIQMLHRVASALNTNIGAFFDHQPRSDVHIARISQRPLLRLEPAAGAKSIALERLLPDDGNRVLQGNIHIVPPGKGSNGAIKHEGEEFGFILEGRLLLQIGEEKYDLNVGDSFAFPSHLDHSYRNPGRKTTRVVWINTPPTF